MTVRALRPCYCQTLSGPLPQCGSPARRSSEAAAPQGQISMIIEWAATPGNHVMVPFFLRARSARQATFGAQKKKGTITWAHLCPCHVMVLLFRARRKKGTIKWAHDCPNFDPHARRKMLHTSLVTKPSPNQVLTHAARATTSGGRAPRAKGSG